MPAKNHQNRSYPARRSPVFNRQIEQLRTGNSLTVCINTHLKASMIDACVNANVCIH